jgi:HTH-type transcriptional regulator, transcriptional repressor of NAD biosynthesis genes
MGDDEHRNDDDPSRAASLREGPIARVPATPSGLTSMELPSSQDAPVGRRHGDAVSRGDGVPEAEPTTAGTGPRLPALGVTVGKFHPPHLGHALLLSEAATLCRELHVLVGEREDQPIPGEQRATWLADAMPDNVVFHVTPDDLPEAPRPWADRALELIGTRPDVACTSETYGDAWADALGARHHPFDAPRARVPISATALREDIAAGFHWLVPAARAALTRRVVLVGAESTGKTTLARRLAEHLGTVWVPEYGRSYWEGRRYLPSGTWVSEEFLHIAEVQAAAEDVFARQARGAVLVADTDPRETLAWEDRYLGTMSDGLRAFVETRRPDLYLVCGDDIPWTDDGTRESGSFRERMQSRVTEVVSASGVPWRTLEGTLELRLSAAVYAINGIPVPEV